MFPLIGKQFSCSHVFWSSVNMEGGRQAHVSHWLPGSVLKELVFVLLAFYNSSLD